MASLEGYEKRLRAWGHRVQLFYTTGTKLKEKPIRHAQKLFEEMKEDRRIGSNATFNDEMVERLSIAENNRYYEGFL